MNDLNNPFAPQYTLSGVYSPQPTVDMVRPASGHFDQQPPRGHEPFVRTSGADFSGTEARGTDSISTGLDLSQPSQPLMDAPSFRASIPVRAGSSNGGLVTREHYPTSASDEQLFPVLYPWDARRDIGLGETNWYGDPFLAAMNRQMLIHDGTLTGHEAYDFQNPNLFQQQLTVATLVPEYGGVMQHVDELTLNVLAGQGLIQSGSKA